jgi:hypothetical protein
MVPLSDQSPLLASPESLVWLERLHGFYVVGEAQGDANSFASLGVPSNSFASLGVPSNSFASLGVPSSASLVLVHPGGSDCSSAVAWDVGADLLSSGIEEPEAFALADGRLSDRGAGSGSRSAESGGSPRAGVAKEAEGAGATRSDRELENSQERVRRDSLRYELQSLYERCTEGFGALAPQIMSLGENEKRTLHLKILAQCFITCPHLVANDCAAAYRGAMFDRHQSAVFAQLKADLRGIIDTSVLTIREASMAGKAGKALEAARAKDEEGELEDESWSPERSEGAHPTDAELLQIYLPPVARPLEAIRIPGEVMFTVLRRHMRRREAPIVLDCMREFRVQSYISFEPMPLAYSLEDMESWTLTARSEYPAEGGSRSGASEAAGARSGASEAAGARSGAARQGVDKPLIFAHGRARFMSFYIHTFASFPRALADPVLFDGPAFLRDILFLLGGCLARLANIKRPLHNLGAAERPAWFELLWDLGVTDPGIKSVQIPAIREGIATLKEDVRRALASALEADYFAAQCDAAV